MEMEVGLLGCVRVGSNTRCTIGIGEGGERGASPPREPTLGAKLGSIALRHHE